MELSALRRMLPIAERGIRQTTRRAPLNELAGQLLNLQLDSERAVPTVGFRVWIPERAHVEAEAAVGHERQLRRCGT